MNRRTPQRIRGSLVVFGLLAVGLAACRTGGEETVEPDNPSDFSAISVSYGRVAQVTVASRHTPEGRQGALDVVAQFVTYAQLDVRTVARSLEMWMPPDFEGTNVCQLMSVGSDADDTSTAARVELMHAGDLYFRSPDRSLTLAPRQMPGLLPFLHGYTYGTELDDRPAYRDGDLVRVWSEGGEAVDGFEFRLRIPAPIAVTFVGGRAVGSASALNLSQHDDLVLLWSPALNAEQIFIELRENSLTASTSIACTASDDGAFTVPRDLVLQLRERSGDGAPLRLSVRRADVDYIRLTGFDDARAVALTEHSLVLY